MGCFFAWHRDGDGKVKYAPEMQSGNLPGGAPPPTGDSVRCLYCGGPQTPAHPECPACRATASFVKCASCGASVPAGDARCRCGAEVHPGQAASAPPCPRCPGHVLALRRLSDGRSCVLQCEGCHGCFVRVRDWGFVVDDSAGGHPIDVGDFLERPAERLTAAQLIETARCPACGKAMDRCHFGLRSPAVVDICQDHGMWLDAGELAPVLDCARGVATTGKLPAETEAERRDMEQFERKLAEDEAKIDAQIDSLFSADAGFQATKEWQSMLHSVGKLFSRRAP